VRKGCDARARQADELELGLGVLAGVVDDPLSEEVDELLSELLDPAVSDEVLALSPAVDGAVDDDFPRLSFL
jgi:hypothetical protein